jgi:hypothetical protein
VGAGDYDGRREEPVLVGYFSALLVPPLSPRENCGLLPGPPGPDRTGGMDPERSETRLRPGEPLPGVPAGGRRRDVSADGPGAMARGGPAGLRGLGQMTKRPSPH